MNLVVVSSRVLHVLTYTRTTPSIRQAAYNMFSETSVILPILFYHVNSVVTGLLVSLCRRANARNDYTIRIGSTPTFLYFDL